MFTCKNFLKIALALLLAIATTHAAPTSETQLFNKLTSLAPTGNAEVQYNLGMLLNNGLGTARNNQEAYRYFSMAAESGHALAAYKVGCYLGGQFPDVVPVNHAEASKYKLRAAEAGYDLAQSDVGNDFAKKGEFEPALIWWERASRQGNMQATGNLAYYLSAPNSIDKVKGYALLLLQQQGSPKASKAVLTKIAELKPQLTADELSAADKIRADWLTGKTPLTIKANAGISAVPALIASLER